MGLKINCGQSLTRLFLFDKIEAMKNKTENVMCAGCGMVDSKNSREWLEVELLGRLQDVKTGSEKPLEGKSAGPFCSQSCALAAQKRLIDEAKEKAAKAGIQFQEVSLNSPMATKMERQEGMMERITLFVLKCAAGGDPDMDVLNDLIYDYQNDLAAHPDAAIGSLLATGWVIEGTPDHYAVLEYITNIGSTTREEGLEHARALKDIVVSAVKRRMEDMPLPEDLAEELREYDSEGMQKLVSDSIKRVRRKKSESGTHSKDEIYESVRQHVADLNPGSGLIYDEDTGVVFFGAHGEDGTIILNELEYADVERLRDRCDQLLTLLDERERGE